VNLKIHENSVYQQFGVTKVTIRPEFFGTVPNFEGLSRKKYKVNRDAELSRISNPVPNLSRFNIKRQTVDQMQFIIDVFACQRCALLSSKRIKSIFGRGSAPDPAGELTTLPRPPNRMGRAMPPPPPHIPLSLGAFGVSISAS